MLRIALIVIALTALQAVAIETAQICRFCGRDHAAAAAADASTERKYAPQRVVDVKHIKIDVTPDFKARTIDATTTLNFVPLREGVRKVVLDAVDLRVEKVEASEKLSDYVVTDRDITLLFEGALSPPAEVEVSIKYTAEPKKGLYFRTKELGYPEEDTHLWTQGETHEARHWFPSFDYPNERSTTEVICHVPTDMTVVSNGRLVEEKESDGLKAVQWKQEKPHVSYLVCLAAGRFAKLEDATGRVPLAFYTQPSLAKHAANSFADTAAILKFYEEEIGVPYPWAKYDQVTCRDFTSGGMENTTLTALTHRTIYSAETENIHNSYELDAHEFAHQWFGDYVTCEDWSHLWLNEGFATFYTHLYNGHKLGRDEMLYGLYTDAVTRVLTEAKDTRPIVYRGYKESWEQFDYRAYPKGSWVLHMLRSKLGEETYRKAIKTYLEKHALSSVVTDELLAELETASGRELDRFFDQWVYHGGFPKLKVTYKWLPEEKLAKVSVTQTPSSEKDVLLFHFPTRLRFYVGDEVVDQPIEITESEHEFFVPLAKQPDGVRFDPEYTVLAEVDFKPPQKMLEAQLKRRSDVIGRIFAVKELAKREDAASRKAVAEALRTDPFYGVRVEAARGLADQQTEESLAVLMDSRDQADARVRLELVTAIGKHYRPAAREALLKVVRDEANPAIVAAAVQALGKYSDEEASKQVAAALERESFRGEIIAAAIGALGDAPSEDAAEKILAALQSHEKRLLDGDLGTALATLGELGRRADDKTSVRELLLAKLTSPAIKVRQGAVTGLGKLADASALAALRPLAAAQDDRIAQLATEAIQAIEDKAPQTPAEVKSLRKEVRELGDEFDKLEQTLEELKAKPKK